MILENGKTKKGENKMNPSFEVLTGMLEEEKGKLKLAMEEKIRIERKIKSINEQLNALDLIIKMLEEKCGKSVRGKENECI